MSWKKIYAVIRREYIERVRTKAFWIGTLLVPIFFLGYIAIQVASFKKTGGERTLVVVDVTGHLFQPLQKDLTAREAEVLRLMANGHSTAGIARDLSYSESTIKNIIHAIVHELGARNRTHAVAMALRTQLI